MFKQYIWAIAVTAKMVSIGDSKKSFTFAFGADTTIPTTL